MSPDISLYKGLTTRILAVLSSLFGYGFLFRNRSECPSLVEIEALSIGMELVQLECGGFQQPDLKSATRSLKNIDFGRQNLTNTTCLFLFLDDGLFFRYGRMEFSSIFEEDLHGYIAIM
ncbi:unnamed protein product [Rhizophagus irregularis]|nr:unnamed protein product [Rhizophagus irregularis]